MSIVLDPDQCAFQQEVRSFIRERLPEEIRQRVSRGFRPSKEQIVQWQRTLNERGWAAPHWPVQYGGAGLGVAQRLILLDELFRACAPTPLDFNVTMLGPLVLRFGTDEQKDFFLPKLANLDLWFCQGFSEPDAGSDLASLRTTARREGDHYVVDGQKIWTTSAHLADWIFCLVRTEKTERKQEGISFLLFDLKTPGVTIRPIRGIDGEQHLNEVFFDAVRVPAGNLLGSEGKGWDYAKYLLANERTGIANVAFSRERLGYAMELAQAAQDGAPSIADEHWFRHEVTLLDAEIRALEVTNWRILLGQQATTNPALASVLKLKGIEMQQRVLLLLSKIVGPAGIEQRSSGSVGFDHWAAGPVPRYLFSRAASIFGGATEIQKDILARSILERT